MRNITKSFPLKVFILAFVLRLIPVIALRSIGIGLDDMFQYDMLARSLAIGNGYRWYAFEDLQLLEPYVEFDFSGVDYDPVRGVETSFRAPLYPVFLALIYLIAGIGPGRFFAARIAQAVLGAALAPLTYWIACTILPGSSPNTKKSRKRVAAVSAWIVALYPILILYPFGLATENLFFPLALFSLLFLMKAADKPSKLNFLLAGIFIALTALTRSIIMLFAAFSILWIWFTLKQRQGAVIFTLALIALIAPWMIRNSLLHKHFTGIESSMGYNLYVGYHPESNGSFTFGVSLDLIPILDDSERDRTGTTQALSFIRDDPGRVFSLALNRLSYFFGLEKRVLVYFYANNFLGYIPPMLLLCILLVILLPFPIVAASAPMGLLLFPRHPKTSLLWLFLLAYIVPHVLILSEDRFHLAIIPVISIMAAHAWVGGFKAIRKWRGDSKKNRPLLVITVSITLLLVFNWGWEIWRSADLLTRLISPAGNTLYLSY